MKTYWDSFLKKYSKYCVGRPLSQILEAFWYYCDQQIAKTDKIMKPPKSLN
jgi:hypothetical protein